MPDPVTTTSSTTAIVAPLGPYLPGILACGALLGIAGFCLVYKVIDSANDLSDSVEQERLRRVLGREATATGTHTWSPVVLMNALKERFKPYAFQVYSINQAQQLALSKQLMYAGRPYDKQAMQDLLTERLVGAVLGGTLGFGLFMPFGIPPLFELGFGILGLYVGGLLPLFSLKGKATARQQAMQRSLPDILDLMVVCVQAGLAVDSTMRRVAKECQSIAPELAAEFNQLGRDLNAGLPRSEAFGNMAHRNGLEELRSLCTLIVQSDRMGVSISSALKVFSEDLRTKRRQRAEELAAKASVKMTLPLVFFVFPPLMIILLGPMLLQIAKTFGGGG
jgi:tight adherence protein C